jgi:F-box and leucine-rich repeat protein GRR1
MEPVDEATRLHADEATFGKLRHEITDQDVIDRLAPEMTIISLGKCKKLTDETIRAIASNCNLLESIDVSGCGQLTNFGLVELASRCEQLKSINVSGCKKLTDETICAIASNCNLLESIDVSGCGQLTDGGLVELVEKCQQLMDIDARMPKVKSRGSFLFVVSETRSYLGCGAAGHVSQNR